LVLHFCHTVMLSDRPVPIIPKKDQMNSAPRVSANSFPD
jgi:hypothetical protein